MLQPFLVYLIVQGRAAAEVVLVSDLNDSQASLFVIWVCPKPWIKPPNHCDLISESRLRCKVCCISNLNCPYSMMLPPHGKHKLHKPKEVFFRCTFKMAHIFSRKEKLMIETRKETLGNTRQADGEGRELQNKY